MTGSRRCPDLPVAYEQVGLGHRFRPLGEPGKQVRTGLCDPGHRAFPHHSVEYGARVDTQPQSVFDQVKVFGRGLHHVVHVAWCGLLAIVVGQIGGVDTDGARHRAHAVGDAGIAPLVPIIMPESGGARVLVGGLEGQRNPV